MILNFLSMNGYGLFVWGSFAITFIACGILYYKTFKTLYEVCEYSDYLQLRFYEIVQSLRAFFIYSVNSAIM